MCEETPLPFLTPWEHIQRMQSHYADLPQLRHINEQLARDQTPLPAAVCDKLGLAHGATVQQGKPGHDLLYSGAE
jgi:hypothetical protein